MYTVLYVKRSCPVDAISAVCRACSYGEYDFKAEDEVTTGSAVIDDELCVYCGWCEGVCPADAVETNKPFKGTLEIDQEACQTCGACVDTCPCNALAFPVSTAPGQRLDRITKHDQYCIRCKACAKACPNGAITVTRTEIDHTPIKSVTWLDAFDAIKN